MRRPQRNVAVIGWMAFMMAIAAEGVFFSMFDPTLLMQAMGAGQSNPPDMPDPLGIYTIGFFCFWGSFTLCGLLAVRLTQALPPGRRPRQAC